MTHEGRAPAMITTHDAAELLGCSEQRAREMCRNGEIKATKIGRRWYVNRHALLELCGLEDEDGGGRVESQ